MIPGRIQAAHPLGDATPRHLERLSAAAGIEGRYTAKMWVAVDDGNEIQAVWWKGCAQPFQKWRKAIVGLGWHPKFCSLTHDHHV